MNKSDMMLITWCTMLTTMLVAVLFPKTSEEKEAELLRKILDLKYRIDLITATFNYLYDTDIECVSTNREMWFENFKDRTESFNVSKMISLDRQELVTAVVREMNLLAKVPQVTAKSFGL